ncbi:major facilitator superfamily domain-containing protein 4A [Gracilinanus agilis]|uniref:major facilitator superfamily domain-containing protein 4A n=1 Tax=Gracilinanus agilis TaxID=191870 RepID=UPI001CFE1DEA|nr:major facilitator superfamily domain-containing protein 4A [Gracilinanus agilis]
MGCHGHISGLFRRNLQPTLTYWSVFFSFGLCTGFLGPTVSDLRCQTHSSLPQISWVFFSQQFCLLLGSALGGIFKRTLAKSLWVLLTSSLTISLVFAVIPFCQDVAVLATVIAIAGLAMGFIDTVANMQLVKIYQKDSAVFLQILHFFVGFGAFLSPLIADPFLSENDCLPTNATNYDGDHFRKILTPHHALPNMTHHELPAHAWVGNQMSYAFWIMALINTELSVTLQKGKPQVPPLPQQPIQLGKGYRPSQGYSLPSPTISWDAFFLFLFPTFVTHLRTPSSLPLVNTCTGLLLDSPLYLSHSPPHPTFPIVLETITAQRVRGKARFGVSLSYHHHTGLFSRDPKSLRLNCHRRADLEAREAGILEPSKACQGHPDNATWQTDLRKSFRSGDAQPSSSSLQTRSRSLASRILVARSQDQRERVTGWPRPLDSRLLAQCSPLHFSTSSNPPAFPIMTKLVRNPPSTVTPRRGHGDLFSCCQKKNFQGASCSFFAIHITAALVLFMTDGIMGEYSAFIYTYAVDDPLFIGHKVAGYLPSIFWGFVTLGRLISIPISSRLKPATMVFINLVGVVATFLFLLFFYHSVIFLFVGTAFLGLFLSSTFPSMLAYTEDILQYNGCATTMLVTGAGIGEMTLQLFIGSIIHVLGKYSFLVCGVIFGCLAFTFYIMLLFFHRIYSRPSSGLISNKSPGIENSEVYQS